MTKVAIIGTVGVPAAYGGFETLVENMLGDNCSEGIEYTVFCSSKDCTKRLQSYKGARLKYVPLKANGIQSIFYDGLSLLRALRGYDVVLVLGVSGGIFFPLFRLLSRSKFIVNIDGLEWKRDKWGALAKFILRLSEKLAVRFADTIIADNQGIVDHVKAEYNKTSELIAYGADHVVRDISREQTTEILEQYGLRKGEYAITVCRIEPENNCGMILEALSESSMPAIFIGNWNKSEYGIELKKQYAGCANIKIADAVYDLETLYVLRANSKFYIHGHSAGGTNPSLVEAMYCRCNILAYDVVYNRETTANSASFFRNEHDIKALLFSGQNNSQQMFDIAAERYKWSVIAGQYEALYE